MRARSRKKQAYIASKAGQADFEYMGCVKQLPCCICNAPPPSDAHHCFHGRYGNLKDAATNTIPLCKRHHQDGPDAIHNIKRGWAERHGFDHSYIPATRNLVADLFAIFVDD